MNNSTLQTGFWLEEENPIEKEVRNKRWDEDYDRPVPLCAVEEMIWEEQAAKEAALAAETAGTEEEPSTQSTSG